MGRILWIRVVTFPVLGCGSAPAPGIFTLCYVPPFVWLTNMGGVHHFLGNYDVGPCLRKSFTPCERGNLIFHKGVIITSVFVGTALWPHFQ